jgi:hypothetical protein
LVEAVDGDVSALVSGRTSLYRLSVRSSNMVDGGLAVDFTVSPEGGVKFDPFGLANVK